MMTADSRLDDVELPMNEIISAIAEHEHMSLEEATRKSAELLSEPWGDAALRQIIWDTLARARQAHKDDLVKRLETLYEMTCRRHKSLCDRRASPTRQTHPFPAASH